MGNSRFWLVRMKADRKIASNETTGVRKMCG